jgi:hypothetical protein
LQAPWKSLGKEPVVIVIDRVFVLAPPDGWTLKLECSFLDVNSYFYCIISLLFKKKKTFG